MSLDRVALRARLRPPCLVTDQDVLDDALALWMPERVLVARVTGTQTSTAILRAGDSWVWLEVQTWPYRLPSSGTGATGAVAEATRLARRGVLAAGLDLARERDYPDTLLAAHAWVDAQDAPGRRLHGAAVDLAQQLLATPTGHDAAAMATWVGLCGLPALSKDAAG